MLQGITIIHSLIEVVPVGCLLKIYYMWQEDKLCPIFEHDIIIGTCAH